MTPVAMATEFGTKSYITRLIYEISARSLRSREITGGIRCRAIEWRQTNSTATNPRCHVNEIRDKIGYKSVCIRYIWEIFAYNMGFSGSGYWMMSRKFYHDRPWLPWQRNLRKLAITHLMWEISPRCLRLVGVYLDRAIKWCQSNSAIIDPGAMATKFKTK